MRKLLESLCPSGKFHPKQGTFTCFVCRKKFTVSDISSIYESAKKSEQIQAMIQAQEEMMEKVERWGENMRNMIQAQEQMMEKMERWGETERRRLHNMVQELKGNIGEEKEGEEEPVENQ